MYSLVCYLPMEFTLFLQVNTALSERGVNKGIFFLLCSDAGDRSCNHCLAALPAAPDARCGGQVLHGKCVGKHIFPVRFEGVCSD